MKSGYEMGLNESKWNNLFRVEEYYWLASASSSNSLYFLSNSGAVRNTNDYEYGVRPVVSLKSEVKAIGQGESGVWDIWLP